MKRVLSLRCVSIFSFVVIGAVAISCSLGSYPPRVLVTVSALPNGRTGPALSQMAHYILSVSGPNTNSLSSSDVQGRSLDCLGLKGQVFFPLSYLQLLSGVQANLAVGDYQFTLLGFDGSGVSTPSALAQLFAASPNLKAYRLAQISASIGKSQTIELVPSYDATTVADLLTQCPRGSYSLHALLLKSSELYYFNNSSGVWTETAIDGANPRNLGSLFVDANAKPHVTYGNVGPPTGVFYSTMLAGVFSPGVAVATSGQTDSYDFSGIVLDRSNIPIVVANFGTGSGNGITKTYEQNGVTFSPGSAVFTGTYSYYRDFSMAISASGQLAATGTASTGGAPLYIAQRSVSGVWSQLATLASADTNACPSGIFGSQAQYAFDGSLHVLYRCGGAVGSYLGYATNRSGSWTTQSLAYLGSSLTNPAFSIDPGGTMHAAYSTGSQVKYVSGDSTQGTFGTPQLIATSADYFDSLLTVARGVSDVWILAGEHRPSVESITQFYNGTGSFVAKSLGDYPSGTAFLSRMYAQ